MGEIMSQDVSIPIGWLLVSSLAIWMVGNYLGYRRAYKHWQPKFEVWLAAFIKITTSDLEGKMLKDQIKTLASHLLGTYWKDHELVKYLKTYDCGETLSNRGERNSKNSEKGR